MYRIVLGRPPFSSIRFSRPESLQVSLLSCTESKPVSGPSSRNAFLLLLRMTFMWYCMAIPRFAYIFPSPARIFVL